MVQKPFFLLEVIGGPLDGQIYPARQEKIIMGRVQNSREGERINDVAFSFDPYVSNRHATIHREQEHWWLTDLNSKNGTWYGQLRLTGNSPQKLKNGSLFTIGNTIIRFTLHDVLPPLVDQKAPSQMAGASRMILEEAASIARNASTPWLGFRELFMALCRSKLSHVSYFFKKSGIEIDKALLIVKGWTDWEGELAQLVNSVLTEKGMLDRMLKAPPATPRMQMLFTRANLARKATQDELIHPLHLIMGMFYESNSQTVMAIEALGFRSEDLVRVAENVYEQMYEREVKLDSHPGLIESSIQWKIPEAEREDLRDITSRIRTTQIIQGQRLIIAPVESRVFALEFNAQTTRAAYMGDQGSINLMLNAQDQDATETCLSIIDNTIAIGLPDARGKAEIVRDFRERIDRHENFSRILGESWTPQEIGGLFLRKLIREIQTHVEGQERFSHLVLCLPVHASMNELHGMRLASSLAGLAAYSAIHAPMAAALDIWHREPQPDSTILVINHDRATLDMAIIRSEHDLFAYRSLLSDSGLGYDMVLKWAHDFFAEEILAHHEQDIRNLPNITLQRNMAEIQRGLIALGKEEEVHLEIDFGVEKSYQTFNRKKMLTILNPLADQVGQMIQHALIEARIELSDINQVAWAGEGAYLLPVYQVLDELFSGTQTPVLRSRSGAVRGAALYSVIEQLRKLDAGYKLPAPALDTALLRRLRKLRIQSVVPHDLGFPQPADASGSRLNCIFERYSHLPQRKIHTLTLDDPGQDQIMLEMLEGDRRNTGKCVPVANIRIRGIPRNVAPGTPIELELHYEGIGLISAKAEIPTFHQTLETTVQWRIMMSTDALNKSRQRVAMYSEPRSANDG